VSLQTILEVVRSPDWLRAWPESQHRDDTVGHYQTRDESILVTFLWGALGIYTMTVDFILSESLFGQVSIPPSLARDQLPNHRHLDQRFACLHLALLVFAHPTVPRKPGEGPFYDPPVRLNSESTYARSTLHHFKIPVAHGLAPVGHILTSIGRVSPDFLESWDKVFQSGQQTTGALGVVHTGWGDVHGEGQAQRIHQEMALATFDPFMRVESADAAGLLDRFHGLGVNDGCARIGVFANASTFGVPQRPPEMRPNACATKLSEVIVGGLPRWEFARQISPRTAGAQEIKDRVEDGAERVAAELSMRRSGR